MSFVIGFITGLLLSGYGPNIVRFFYPKEKLKEE